MTDSSVLATSHSALIDEMLSRYGRNFLRPQNSNNDTSLSYGPPAILITGTTGNLGAELLSLLLTTSQVGTIYALNRRSTSGVSSEQRHRDMFTKKALNLARLEAERLIYLEGDTSAPSLGLPPSTYETLIHSVTHIIHVAWPIGLSRPLSSFEPNILGLRNLLDLAANSPGASTLRFIFISSLRAAQSWDLSAGPIPEEALLDSGVAAGGGGYGESKFIAERIVAQSGLRATSIRVGQICGRRSNGQWSSTEWFPKLIKSSAALGMFPSASGLASWLHVEPVAQGILDVTFSPEDPPSTLNFFHPKPVEFNFLMRSICSAIQRKVPGDPRLLRLVPFDDWFRGLEELAEDPTKRDLENVPGFKLIETFRAFAGHDSALPEAADMEHFGLRSFSTKKAQQFSPTIRDLERLKTVDAYKWVDHWVETGYIQAETKQSRL